MDLVNDGSYTPFEGDEERVRTPICALSGLGATPHCPAVVDEWLEETSQPCDWHTSACEVDWPPEYAAWAAESAAGSGCRTAGSVTIASPGDGATYYVDPRLPVHRQRVPFRAAVPAGSLRADWLVDGVLIDSVDRPFEAMWAPKSKGMHRVELIVDGRRAPSVDVWIGGVENEVE